jgi:hypothetical protein
MCRTRRMINAAVSIIDDRQGFRYTHVAASGKRIEDRNLRRGGAFYVTRLLMVGRKCNDLKSIHNLKSLTVHHHSKFIDRHSYYWRARTGYFSPRKHKDIDFMILLI